ncbi:MAG: sensor histidine kinase [Candidatus Hydrogenedentota bacterium]
MNAIDIHGDMTWLEDASPEETKRIVEALYRVHHLISAMTDSDSLLVQIMLESKAVAQAQACSLLLYDDVAGELYFQVALGESGDQHALMREVRLKLGQGIAGAAAETRKSINVPDVQSDTRFFPGADATSHFQTHNLLAVPMVDREELIGVIEVLNKVDAEAFAETDLRVMEMFAALAASAVSNARLIEENIRRERLAALGQAVAGLSHYAKNIITSMSGGTDLIEQGLQQKNYGLIEQAWPVVKRSTRRIANVVQDMLTYSRARGIQPTPCNLDEVFSEVCDSFRQLFAQRNARIEVDTSGLPGPLRVDAQGLHRCLLNLVSNAAEAVQNREGVVQVVGRMEGANLLVEVIDNGPGVPRENRERIFEPFYTTKGTRGTGLGLAVSRKIAQEHGGNLTVESGPEEGARFVLQIPTPAEAREA